MAIVIGGPPQIVPCAVDGAQDLVQVPRVPRSGAPPAQRIGVGWPELPAPRAYRLRGQFGPQLFDVPVAPATAAVAPHTVAEHLRRKAMTLIQLGDGWSVHAARMARETGAGQVGR
jgi:hypothetical protein